MFVQVSQAVLENQFASVDDSGMGGHLVDFTEQMAGNHDGHAVFLRKGADQLAHFLDAGRIQPVCRFIQKKQAGTAKQGCGQAQALLHAKGIVAGFFILLLFHADNMQDIINFFFRDAF